MLEDMAGRLTEEGFKKKNIMILTVFSHSDSNEQDLVWAGGVGTCTSSPRVLPVVTVVRPPGITSTLL